MTVLNSTRSNSYTGDGTVQEYTYAFKILAKSHLRVTVTDTDGVESVLQEGNDYTVTRVGQPQGTIILTAGPLADQYGLVIERVVPMTQETDYKNANAIYLDVLEDDADLRVMQILQMSGGGGTGGGTGTGVDTTIYTSVPLVVNLSDLGRIILVRESSNVPMVAYICLLDSGGTPWFEVLATGRLA